MANLAVFVVLVYLAALPLQSVVAQDADAANIEAILKKMTLKQKIGQMLLPPYSYILKSGSSEVDAARVGGLWQNFGLGTIYGPRPVFINNNRVGGFCRQWQQLVKTAQAAALASGSPPILFGLLAQHGANYLANATIFPHNIGAGATYNSELVQLSGKITGKDLRTCGLAWAISPAIDLAIEPRWARNYECHSSEPYLGAVMADAVVRGIEDRSNPFFTTGRAQVGTIVKHFIGYSNPDSGGDRQDASNPDWMIERFHLPPFRSAFAAGALAVMYNSGSVNKVPGHANPALTVNLLRQKLNYTGLAVSDYDDVNKLVGTHKVAPNFRAAVKMAIQAGLDVTMIPQTWAETLLNLVESGEVPVSRVDESVRRILNTKVQLGLFEQSGPFEQLTDTIGQPSDRAAALQMASESITLLQNKNDTLPILLDKSSTKGSILVTGPCANSIRLQSGGWTILWEGANDDSEFYGHGATFFQAIKTIAETAGWNVNYVEGASVESLSNLPDALNAARRANYTFVCLGEKPYVEFLYDIQDLNLQKHQIDFVTELRKVSQKLVLVLAQGRPRLFTPLIPQMDAILYTYLPGPYGGPALANIAFGRTNPSGKLSFPYPSANGQMAIPYGKWKHTPQWPLGFGLSYSRFVYSDLQVPETVAISSPNQTLTVSVTVTNAGPYSGMESVLLFMEDYFAYPTPELSFVLRRFTKVSLGVRDSVRVTFTLTPIDFRHLIDPSSKSALNVSIRIENLQSQLILRSAAGITVPLSAPDPLPKDTVRVQRLGPAPEETAPSPVPLSSNPTASPTLPPSHAPSGLSVPPVGATRPATPSAASTPGPAPTSFLSLFAFLVLLGLM